MENKIFFGLHQTPKVYCASCKSPTALPYHTIYHINMSRNPLLLRCFVGALACLSILVSGLSRGGNSKDRCRDGRPVLDLTCRAHLSAAEAGIRVGDTPSKGLGAFALAPIVSGSFVGEYKGEILTLSQVQARYWMTKKKQTADRRWTKSRKQRNQGISGGLFV